MNCKVCNCPPDKPYRHTVKGVITEGCISAFHTGHLEEGSPSFEWHNRQSAQAFRRNNRFDFNPLTGYWIKKP